MMQMFDSGGVAVRHGVSLADIAAHDLVTSIQ